MQSHRALQALFVLNGLSGAALGASRSAHPPPAEEILRKGEAVRCPAVDYTVDFRLDVTDPDSPWKARFASYTLIAHGKDESLVLMREPSPFYPGTLLISRGSYWLLLPRSDRPLQLSPRQVLGGDIANGDLARGNLLAYYTVRYDGEERVRDEPCHRLELLRTSDLGLHPRIRYWITQRDGRPMKLEYYGETGALLKTAWYEDYRKGPIGVRSMRVEVDSHVRPSERSVLTFTGLRKLDLRGRRFDQQALKHLRDAALVRLDSTGSQAQTEDLLRAISGPAAP